MAKKTSMTSPATVSVQQTALPEIIDNTMITVAQDLVGQIDYKAKTSQQIEETVRQLNDISERADIVQFAINRNIAEGIAERKAQWEKNKNGEKWGAILKRMKISASKEHNYNAILLHWDKIKNKNVSQNNAIKQLKKDGVIKGTAHVRDKELIALISTDEKVENKVAEKIVALLVSIANAPTRCGIDRAVFFTMLKKYMENTELQAKIIAAGKKGRKQKKYAKLTDAQYEAAMKLKLQEDEIKRQKKALGI